MDGGATKTLCAVGTQGSMLANAIAGPSTLLRASEETVRASLRDSISNACNLARVAPEQIVAACLGSTGAARADIARTLHAMLAALLPNARIQVCGDMEIALAAAFGSEPGVVVVSGTGSISFGRSADGRTARAGGKGPETSDEGSGYWIGKRAMEFMEYEPAAPPAALVPAVIAEAKKGNTPARLLLAEAGTELAKLAAAVCEDLSGPSKEAGERIRVAMAGGVFKHSLEVRRSFADELAHLYPQASVAARVIEPVKGALWMARKLQEKERST